jgi:hypothetical protein
MLPQSLNQNVLDRPIARRMITRQILVALQAPKKKQKEISSHRGQKTLR